MYTNVSVTYIMHKLLSVLPVHCKCQFTLYITVDNKLISSRNVLFRESLY